MIIAPLADVFGKFVLSLTSFINTSFSFNNFCDGTLLQKKNVNRFPRVKQQKEQKENTDGINSSKSVKRPRTDANGEELKRKKIKDSKLGAAVAPAPAGAFSGRCKKKNPVGEKLF